MQLSGSYEHFPESVSHVRISRSLAVMGEFSFSGETVLLRAAGGSVRLQIRDKGVRLAENSIIILAPYTPYCILDGSVDPFSGTAAECDYLSVKAERLHAEQQHSALQSQKDLLTRMLSVFCGIEVTHPTLPQAALSDSHSDSDRHPELRLADARLRLADAQEKSLQSRLLPRLSIFAQGYYGYPGMNLFEDMMGRRWSWNGLVGARLSWNIGALYTHKNDKAKIQHQREAAENYRDVFLFNNQLEQMKYDEQTARYRQQMTKDAEIVALRSSVRKAAESKLAHGIIDVNALIKEINNENAARIEQSIHEIEMWKSVYERELKGK